MTKLPELPLLFTGLFLSVQCLAQSPDLSFPEGDKAKGIPFALSNNLVCLQIRVNGSEPSFFILDTGAGYNVIDSDFASKIGLARTERQVSPATGMEYYKASGLTISLPGLEARNETARIMNIAQLSPFAGVPVAGILGYDFIKKFVFTIDYQNGTVSFYSPEAYKYKGHGEPVSFDLTEKQHWPVMTARIDPEKGEPMDVRLLIDTGAMGSLSLSIPDLCLITIPNTITIGATGSGTGGVIGRLKAVNIGKIRLAKTLAAMPAPEDKPSDDPIAKTVSQLSSGNVGGELLRRFTVTFDYPNRIMYLEPNHWFKQTMEHDMCGTFLVDQFDPERGFQVLAITPGSPAEKAGIKTGDLITAINGQQVGQVTLSQAKDLFRRHGSKASLKITRDGQPLEITVKLQRMI